MYKSLLFISLIFLFLNVSGEESSISLAPEDEVWMNEFVDDFFLNNTMIYSLFGTKPMSGVVICKASENECIKSWEPHLVSLNQIEKSEFLKKLHEYCGSDNFYKNYQKWLEWKKKRTSALFLFRTSVSKSKHYLLVDMINTRETLWLLKKNYELFSKETGMEFDPLTVVFDFENDSAFWSKVFSNSYLMGILYGFGERNAYFFSLYIKNDPLNGVNRKQHPLFDSNASKTELKKNCSENAIESLGIPNFRSFNMALGEDPIITHFKMERESIQNFLKNKNVTKEVLHRVFLP